MVASNSITVAHVAALLKATPPEQRADVPPPDRDSKTAPWSNWSSWRKRLVRCRPPTKTRKAITALSYSTWSWPKGYLTKLLANGAVKSYIEKIEPEILSHQELVANTVSMEEAVQQKKEETS